MDVGVAFLTRLASDFVIKLINASCVVNRAGVISPRMAPLAQVSPLGGEHFFVVGAVGVVAVETVFTDRLVLPQMRAPLVLVTLETELVGVGGV